MTSTSWWEKTLLTAASVTGLAVGTYSLLTRKPLPQKSGVLHLEGLHEPTRIVTDHFGIPHIYARNEDDLYFAQGYIHAQERLWQMELNRRLGSGRLSEIFGKMALETDRFTRRLGLHRAAEAASQQLSPHSRRILDAYVQGVNAFLQGNGHKLPVEFTLLRFTPEKWCVRDVLQWSKIQGWNLSGNWETEIIRAKLVAKLGVEKASKLESGYDPQHPLIVPPGADYGGINLGLLEQYENMRELTGFGPLGGSNNWVVDGTMTKSGLPLLCNDPHLGQSSPSLYFECHLVAGDIDVTGVSFPGAPGVVIGHNQHIAWGITNAISDVEDLYIEKFNPDNPHQYEFMGQWVDAEAFDEKIFVKGEPEPVIEQVLVTRHGPILTSLEHNGRKALPLALRWTGFEQHNIVNAIQKINRATNWAEFRDGLRDWDVPAQNFVYADREGNIGYTLAGAIPIRAQGLALVPSPGWTGAYEWTGLVPFDELPQSYNPEQHFIVTANNRIVDDSYPYYITHEWLNGYRAQRIRDLLANQSNLTVEDMVTIQADQYSLPAAEIVPILLRLTLTSTTPLQRAALEILQTWDYTMTPESIGAAIYAVFQRKLGMIVFDPLLGDDHALTKEYMGAGSTIFSAMNGYAGRSTPLLIRLLKERDDSWFANSAIANGPRTWAVALERAFEATLDELSTQLGRNILRWQYGAIHKMTCVHPLGTVKVLEKFFNRGPYPLGGDSDTVNVGASSYSAPQNVLSIPAYRQIVDLGDFENSRAIHLPGQSGHPASKHYDDFVPLWRANKYHPVYFDADTIERSAEGIIELSPKQ